jgi:hypothetical protein
VWVENSARRDHGKSQKLLSHKTRWARDIDMRRQGTREKRNACHCNPHDEGAHAQCNTWVDRCGSEGGGINGFAARNVPLLAIALALCSGTPRTDWEPLLLGVFGCSVEARNGQHHGPTEQPASTAAFRAWAASAPRYESPNCPSPSTTYPCCPRTQSARAVTLAISWRTLQVATQ